MKMMSRPTPGINGLYAITPDQPDTEILLHQVLLALQGGAHILQYRNKQAGEALREKQALALRAMTREHGALLIINDDAQLARQVDADGVHLGRGDASLQVARVLLGDHKIIGISCYNQLPLAREAVAAGADYVAFGAFFPSPTKPEAATADTELLYQAHHELGVPVVAIGGITARNGAALVEAGADALAVITAVFEAPDVRAAAQEFTALFKND
jgi:thiamine-phosphate pyrophosphorylase